METEDEILVLVPQETLYQLKVQGLKHRVVAPVKSSSPVGKKVIAFEDNVLVFEDGSYAYPYCSCNSGFWWMEYSTDPEDPCVSVGVELVLRKLGLRKRDK